MLGTSTRVGKGVLPCNHRQEQKKNRRTILLGILIVLVVSLTLFAANRGRNPSSASTEMKSMEHLTMESFKEKICDCGVGGNGEAAWNYKGDIPAVIDFYADWCGPCKIVSPILEQLSVEYKGRVNMYKVNTENERELAGLFGISSIPSILFVPVGGKPQMAMGAMPRKELQRIMKETLGVEAAAVPLEAAR